MILLNVRRNENEIGRMFNINAKPEPFVIGLEIISEEPFLTFYTDFKNINISISNRLVVVRT